MGAHVDITDDREDSASLESLQMTPAKPHRRIETRDRRVSLLSRQTTAFALESAENEGWNMGGFVPKARWMAWVRSGR